MSSGFDINSIEGVLRNRSLSDSMVNTALSSYISFLEKENDPNVKKNIIDIFNLIKKIRPELYAKITK